MSTQFFGLTFHLYGLILGLAASTGFIIAEKLFHCQKLPQRLLYPVILSACLGGLLGARAYHVVTDWSVYSHHLNQVFSVWNGGLSIIGAVFGGCVGVWTALFLSYRTGLDQLPEWSFKKVTLSLIDITALVLPIAQAIGRVGNYVNQELYGLPTQLPWKLSIDLAHRLAGYEQIEFYHPLFAYEAIGMLIFAAVSWMCYRNRRILIGSGSFGLCYGAWYGLFRGSLEFLRIDKAYWGSTQLGVNQVLYFLIGMSCVGILFLRHHHRQLDRERKILGLIIGVIGLTWLASGCGRGSTAFISKTDHSQLTLTIRRQAEPPPLTLRVEVVNSEQSREQGLSGRDHIGSDGMLFIFPTAQIQHFWMKEMKFDLDLVWLKEKKIVQISQRLPHPDVNTLTSALPIYQSNTPVDSVLEVPAGTAEKWKLTVGDAFDQE